MSAGTKFSSRISTATSLLVAMTMWALPLGASAQDAAKQPEHRAPAADASSAEGRKRFESRCAACHGLDGRGAERAPDIATRESVQQRSDADLSRIIHDGIPASGMPAFNTLDETETRALVRHLRSLQGKSEGTKVAGDPARGSAVFFEKGRCVECHLIEGKGGFLGPDLSAFGASRKAQEIHDAIVKPSRNGRLGERVVVAMRDGTKYSGLVRNEDNFSLQLQDLNGGFHLFSKTEVAKINRESESLMPSDYGSTLAPRELDDLIAFLVRAAEQTKAAQQKRENEEDEE
jgi:cytochrome c oxidase cbb3-type subunit III